MLGGNSNFRWSIPLICIQVKCSDDILLSRAEKLTTVKLYSNVKLDIYLKEATKYFRKFKFLWNWKNIVMTIIHFFLWQGVIFFFIYIFIGRISDMLIISFMRSTPYSLQFLSSVHHQYFPVVSLNFLPKPFNCLVLLTCSWVQGHLPGTSQVVASLKKTDSLSPSSYQLQKASWLVVRLSDLLLSPLWYFAWHHLAQDFYIQS